MKRTHLFLRFLSLALALCLTGLCCPQYSALSSKAEDHAGFRREPEEDLVITKHTSVINGKKIDYTATTGTIMMDNEYGQYEMFFTAYTADGTEDMSERPVTFAFNGGPGSASLWLHIGALGPERIDLDKNGMVKKCTVKDKAE